jgi:hypothetical protein
MFPFPFSFVAPTASGLADIDNAYSMEFDGVDDYLIAFDYILTQDQVDEIYNATSTGKTADLSTMATPPVAWYRMGD